MTAHIDVEGIIGVGKTTFVRELTTRFDIKPVYEPIKDNPFLDKFYADPRRYAFIIQMWLLAKRNAANKAAYWLSRAGDNVVVDRGRLGDRCFARVNAAIGNMTADELAVYEEHFQALGARDPNVIVFLDVDEDQAMLRIAKRGRQCEKKIDTDYLHLLRTEHHLMVEDARGRGVQVLVSPAVDDVAMICGLEKLDQNDVG